MDVERTVAKRLMDATGVAAVLEVPDPRPEEFISVELVGGGATRFAKSPILAVQSWAKTRRRAVEIAGLVEVACDDLMDEESIFGAQPTGTGRWPDPESKQERYQTTVELTVYE